LKLPPARLPASAAASTRLQVLLGLLPEADHGWLIHGDHFWFALIIPQPSQPLGPTSHGHNLLVGLAAQTLAFLAPIPVITTIIEKIQQQKNGCGTAILTNYALPSPPFFYPTNLVAASSAD
jgi:hypothetical protein